MEGIKEQGEHSKLHQSSHLTPLLRKPTLACEMATMNATLALRDPAFETALQRFKIGLTDADIDNFQFTSLQELKTTICDLQAKQASTRTAKNMARLKVFLEGMEQYGKVIEVFLNASGYVAFIWVSVQRRE